MLLSANKLCVVLLGEARGVNAFRFLVNRPIEAVATILFQLDRVEGVADFVTAFRFDTDSERHGTAFELEFSALEELPAIYGRIALTLSEHLAVPVSDTLLVRPLDSTSSPVVLSYMKLQDFCVRVPACLEGYYTRREHDESVIRELEDSFQSNSRTAWSDE